MPVDSFGQRNVFRPSSAITDPAGWSSIPLGFTGISAVHIPDRILTNGPADLFDSDTLVASLANPPFTSGASGRINTMIHDGQAGKIQRGYIRRAQVDPADTMSKSRLYFMYNPPSVTRQYIAYLDQAALDPFNTIYGSANLVAPPGFLDFSFELFFDRQEEAVRDSNNRGVFVDYEFFDMVVRNVPPTDSGTGTGSTLQDNGVMLINPRDLTVVFSKDLTVQGRAYNAGVTFTKFTNRMVPIRMSIQITMKVLYIGPERPQTQAVDFNVETSYKITVPYSQSLGLPFTTSTEIAEFRAQLENSIRSGIERLTASAEAGGALDLSGAVLNDRQILTVVQTIGIPQDQWMNAIAICLAESGGVVSRIGGPNKLDGTYDRGLWQINDVHAEYDKQQLITFPMYNARAMYTISGGGTNWTPWTTYTNGKYQTFLPRAQAAIDAGPVNLYIGGSQSNLDFLAAQEAANAPSNSDIQARVLAFAKQFVGLPYVPGGTSLVTGADCSGFVFACYREQGLLTAMRWENGLGGGSGGGVSGMIDGWENRNWDSALLLLNWSPNDDKTAVQQQLFNTLRPGDFLLRYRHPRSEHVAFFSRWVGDNPYVFEEASQVGYANENNLEGTYNNWVTDAFNWAVRPRPIGALNASRGGG